MSLETQRLSTLCLFDLRGKKLLLLELRFIVNQIFHGAMLAAFALSSADFWRSWAELIDLK